MLRGALTRLGIAGFASFAAADYAKDPATAVVTALATVAAGYLTNRVNAVEDEALEAARLSKNHHLQIALAGAFRNSLQEIKYPLPDGRGSSYQLVAPRMLNSAVHFRIP